MSQKPKTAPEGGPGIPGQGTGVSTEDATTKRTGLYMSSDHRYWFNGKGPFPSVTTILKVIDKPALVSWAKREVAQSAIRHLDELPGMVAESGGEQAARWLASTPDHRRDTAAQLGSSVHLLADMASRADGKAPEGFEIPEATIPYLDAFRGFLKRYSASTIVSSEKAIISLSDGYAGTYDLLMRIEGQLWLIDIKTSKGIYPEYGLQLAGYAHGEFIALPDDPQLYPMPKVERFGILHLRPELYQEGWRLAEFGVTDRDYLAFLAALELHQWQREGRFKSA